MNYTQLLYCDNLHSHAVSEDAIQWHQYCYTTTTAHKHITHYLHLVWRSTEIPEFRFRQEKSQLHRQNSTVSYSTQVQTVQLHSLAYKRVPTVWSAHIHQCQCSAIKIHKAIVKVHHNFWFHFIDYINLLFNLWVMFISPSLDLRLGLSRAADHTWASLAYSNAQVGFQHKKRGEVFSKVMCFITTFRLQRQTI